MRMKLTIQTTRETRNNIMKFPPESRSRLPPPPKNGRNLTSIWAMEERNVAMVMTIMSLFFTCVSSCASTASSSLELSCCMMPVVTATTAFF